MSETQVVRVSCPHRIGLAYRTGDYLSLLPCDCNEPSKVLEVVADASPAVQLRSEDRAALRQAYLDTAEGGYVVLYRAVARILAEREAER